MRPSTLVLCCLMLRARCLSLRCSSTHLCLNCPTCTRLFVSPVHSSLPSLSAHLPPKPSRGRLEAQHELSQHGFCVHILSQAMRAISTVFRGTQEFGPPKSATYTDTAHLSSLPDVCVMSVCGAAVAVRSIHRSSARTNSRALWPWYNHASRTPIRVSGLQAQHRVFASFNCAGNKRKPKSGTAISRVSYLSTSTVTTSRIFIDVRGNWELKGRCGGVDTSSGGSSPPPLEYHHHYPFNPRVTMRTTKHRSLPHFRAADRGGGVGACARAG